MAGKKHYCSGDRENKKCFRRDQEGSLLKHFAFFLLFKTIPLSERWLHELW